VNDCTVAERLIRRCQAAEELLADKAYDSAELRDWLEERGTDPVIPNRSNRKQPFPFKRRSYKLRHKIENAICRLKDFRRIATRYDKLARNFSCSHLPGCSYRLVDLMSLDPRRAARTSD
jgi:transposase